MLLNNFKPIISFNTTVAFVNVLGNTVTKEAMLAGQSGGSSANNHSYTASNLQYNYNATTASNTYTNEQTSYTWAGVTRTTAENYGGVNNFANGFTLFVGSGTTAVTAADYKLDTPLTLDVLSASCLPQANEKVYVQRTFKNSTGSSVTVNEIGCYLFNTVSPGVPVVMIGRKVLESSVTIANGDLYTFTYVIDMSNIILV